MQERDKDIMCPTECWDDCNAQYHVEMLGYYEWTNKNVQL